jgi:hypothetical protein
MCKSNGWNELVFNENSEDKPKGIGSVNFHFFCLCVFLFETSSFFAWSRMKKLFNQRKDTKQSLSDEVNGAAEAASGAATTAAADAANAANAAASNAAGAAGAAVTAAASSEPPSVPSKSKTPSLVSEGRP